jgi:ubiquinone/menaquinone biosynthesis C-methylase UbiE
MAADDVRGANALRDEYTHGHHPSVVRTHSWRTVENSAAYLVPHLAAGLDVLDVGSGPGTITIDLARRVRPGRVIGIDASAEIVATASGLAASDAVPNAEFRVGDAYALEFADDSFDVVHAHQVLQHLARPVDALREFRRVLKPGGVLGVRDVDYGGVIWSPASPGLRRWLELYHDVHEWNGGEPCAGRLLKTWVRDAGFTDLEASGSTWVFSSTLEREWWGGSWAERATQSQFAAHAIESGHSNPAELERIATAWRDWVDDENGWFLMPHGEILARA